MPHRRGHGMADENEILHTGPLTEAELRELRRILETERRARWAWSLLRQSVAWIAALVGGAIAFRNDLAELMKWMFAK